MLRRNVVHVCSRIIKVDSTKSIVIISSKDRSHLHLIQSASYLVCFGKREKKREKKTRKKGRKKSQRKKKERKKKKCEKKKERGKKQNSDLSRLNLVVEFGLESVLCTVQ